ncbi:hypothetical protein HDU96_002735 [Phlyctochytrium bullatum]|nr:hypothetical protein HDU96_002735 [Phlyctochytrium bullatum]
MASDEVGPRTIESGDNEQAITIVVLLPYAVQNDGDGIYGDDNMNATVASMDLATELAVEDAARSGGILQGVKVNLVKVNNWREDFSSSENASLTDSGGYAAVAVYDTLQKYGAAGIVGEYYSRTAIFSGGVSSQFKVPHCGTSQSSPKLSNKKEYEYFFRMQEGAGFGLHLAKLLRHFEVQRVILIGGTDSFAKALLDDISKTFARLRIVVADTIKVKPEAFLAKEFSTEIARMKRGGVNYFVNLLYSGDSSLFFFAAAEEGLVGSNYGEGTLCAWKYPSAVNSFINAHSLKLIRLGCQIWRDDLPGEACLREEDIQIVEDPMKYTDELALDMDSIVESLSTAPRSTLDRPHSIANPNSSTHLSPMTPTDLARRSVGPAEPSSERRRHSVSTNHRSLTPPIPPAQALQVASAHSGHAAVGSSISSTMVGSGHHQRDRMGGLRRPAILVWSPGKGGGRHFLLMSRSADKLRRFEETLRRVAVKIITIQKTGDSVPAASVLISAL